MKKGWQTRKLGELCEIELGKTPARANKAFWDEKRETGNVWLSIADLLNAEDNVVVDSKEYLSDKGASISKTVCKGTLLVSFKLTLGRLAFAGRNLFTNEAIAALTIFNEHELSKEFLFYFLHFFDWRKVAENDVKLKGMTLNKAKLKEMPVHFPSPDEQHRIVGMLDKAFEGITTAKTNAEKNLKNARAIFESHLQYIFTQRGPGWKQKTLEEIATTFGRGKSKHRPRNEPKLYGGKYPFIQTGDIRNADHFITEYSQTYSEAGLAQSKQWPKGTICITIAANIAETGILGFDACFPDSVIGVVTNPKEAEVGFVEYLLQSFKARIQAMGKGSAQANINMGTFENERFPFPSVAEQKQIVAKLDSLRKETEHLEAIYRQKLATLEALKKSLLHQAFTGQL
ncbi:MAG: restriction endonuclease subunit S [Deltaproteobacteria bacterium CG11_big_fil_rev_8_21_14_0_20_49_13]|nr:MAG: restriction endonuclease subunit S [Deltaproteobacteria bacterium CG11_big_fil_rev_8_21_14_0_20_49_13]